MAVRSLSVCLLALLGAPASTQPAPAEFGMDAGHILTSCPAPRFALAGDADGDGRADFLSLNPTDHTIDLARMTASGKLTPAAHARESFGGAPIAAACGAFSGSGGAETLGLFADGSVLVAYGMKPGAKIYAQVATAATIPRTLLPKSPACAVAADFDGDGKPDVLIAGADGRLLLLRNSRGADAAPQFTPEPVGGASIRCKRLAAGDLTGAGKAELVWIDLNGDVRRAGLDRLPSGSIRLAHSAVITNTSKDDGLAVGRFRGEKAADILIGQRLLPGGDAARSIPMPDLRNSTQAKEDSSWIAADLNGDGKDDLIRVRRSRDPLDSDHVYVHYTHDSRDREALRFDDSDNDGLLDAWETGALNRGGIDLKALGCTTRHADVIIEIQRFEDVPEPQLRSDLDKAIRYFASLPVRNPDGAPGITLHLIYRDPIPKSDSGMSWWALQEKYHPASHRGVTHWMMVYNGGGGQSSEMGDGGGCGRFGMPAVFIHEFGHQLGLDHTGRWAPGWCPTYPSLMNYAYNYQLNGKAENVGFSDGRLGSVVLNERHLNEYLPLSMDKVAFLAGPPYRYRMKPAPDGKGTLIDWNWNGIFGEKDISADINYGYSTSGGERHIVGKAYTAPAMASLGEGRSAKLLLIYGQLPPGAPPPPAEIKAKNHSLSVDMPGRLCVRVWKGSNPAGEGDKWSEETTIDSSGVTGEASAVTIRHAVWTAFPTVAGVQLCRITLDATGAPKADSPAIVPDSDGAQPTLAAFAGRLVLMLWRDRKSPLGFRWVDPHGGRPLVGVETKLEFTSNVPIGAAAGVDGDGNPALWIGLTQDQDAKRPSRWQIRCLRQETGDSLRQPGDGFWVDGENGGDRGEGRVTLLWEPDRALGPAGRWYFLQRWGPGEDLNQMRIAMRTADKSVNGGSLTRRYYDEWTNSRCAPGACWFRGDIALGLRWFGDAPAYKNDDLLIGFFGRGIESAPMGDFNDLAEIRDYGLTRSLATMNE